MKFNSKSRTKKILVATWAIPVVLASPYTFSTSFPFVITSPLGSIARQICNDRFDEIDAAMYGPGTTDRFRGGFFIFLFLVIYLLPMLVILATCVRITLSLLQPIAVRRWPSATGKDSGRRHEENKRKVARMVIVVAVAFIVSWSPFYLTTLVSQIQSISGDSFLREGNFVFSMLMIHLCGFLNSCINPLIYTGMSQKFRRSFKMILSGCICCRLTYRFLRYRDSITRGGAFTSTMCQSMTEVHDSNDLALSEAGSSSGDRPPFHSRSHSRRSQSRSPCHSDHGSFRQPPHQRRPNHPRRYNLSQETHVDLSRGQPLSPDVVKGKSRSFKLWKGAEGPQVVIQLTTLQCGKEKQPGKIAGEEVKSRNTEHGNSLHLTSGREHHQGRNCCTGDDGDSWLKKDAESKAPSQDNPRLETSRLSEIFHDSCLVTSVSPPGLKQPQTTSTRERHIAFNADPMASEHADPFSDYLNPGGTENLQNQHGSSFSSKRDVPDDLIKDSIPLTAIEEWNGVVMKGDSPNKLRTAVIEWTDTSQEYTSQSKRVSSQGPQNQVNPVTVCSTNQHGALVHVGLSTNGQCVQL